MKQQQLDMLSANYAMHNKGTPFNGFYCPIQLRETNEELCDGHEAASDEQNEFHDRE